MSEITASLRSLTIAEQRYAQIEKELLAIVFACEHLNQYTYGRQVSIESDHKPLEYILHKPLSEAPPRIERLLIRLQKYQVIVKYVPGKDLHIAGSLSRAYLNIFDQDDSLNEDCSIMVHTLVQNLPISTDRLKHLQHKTKVDSVLSQITKYISYGWPRNRQILCGEEKKYWTIRNNLHIAEGIILKENKIVIPTDMRPLILTQLHLSHLGTEKTKAKARNVDYWPGLISNIDKLILNCHKCLKYRNNNKKEKIIQHDIPDLPWSKVGSDIYELHGKIYVIVIDYFSKFIENSIIPDKTAFSGIPSSLNVDNNPYNSTEFLNFSKEYGFNFTPSSPNYPQSNGLSEMGVKIIKKILKKCDNPELGLLEYLNMPLTGMDYSQSQLLMNRKTQTTIPAHHDLLIPAVPVNAYSQITKSRNSQKQYYDRNTSELPNLVANDTAHMRKDEKWKKVTVKEKLRLPRSYNVVDK
nr:uncharacterized protein K02A2.6-like [Hydra vulgaris]